jgi:hypothetical protein
MSRHHKFGFILLIVVLLLAACQPKEPVKTYPTPEAGKASASGRLLSINSGEPYYDVIVRLAEIYENEAGDRAFALDMAFSPIAFTDKDGYFLFENIEAREYVFIVGDPMAWSLIPTEEADQKPKAWNFPADIVTDMGTMKVDFDLK